RLLSFTLFPYTTLFRSLLDDPLSGDARHVTKFWSWQLNRSKRMAYDPMTALIICARRGSPTPPLSLTGGRQASGKPAANPHRFGDRKSTRLNSSHVAIS